MKQNKEKPPSKLSSILLEEGKSYLVEEKKPDYSFKIFHHMAENGFSGLCITRTHPDYLKKLGLDKVAAVWLAKTPTSTGMCPSNLETLREMISRHMQYNKNNIVLLDGLEYLVTMNGFDLTMKFLYDVCELTALNKSRLIIPANPQAFEPRQLAILERYMEVIKE
jgi:hypothetical protein